MANSSTLLARGTVHKLLSGEASASGTGSAYEPLALHRAYQVVISSAATVNLQASLDNSNWVTLKTSTASEAYSTSEPWTYLRVTWSDNDGTISFLVGS